MGLYIILWQIFFDVSWVIRSDQRVKNPDLRKKGRTEASVFIMNVKNITNVKQNSNWVFLKTQ